MPVGALRASVQRVAHADRAAGEGGHHRLEQVVRRALEDGRDPLECAAADAEAVAAALDVAPALLGADARQLRGARLRQPVLFTKCPDEGTTDLPDLVLAHVCLRSPLALKNCAHSPQTRRTRHGCYFSDGRKMSIGKMEKFCGPCGARGLCRRVEGRATSPAVVVPQVSPW